jgi:hypothetical protein
MSFDIRVKSGSLTGHINIVDIVITTPATLPVNQPPVARAGNDSSITLPVDSVQLNGGSSFDPDGTVTGYAWRKISGPSSFDFSDTAIANPVLRNLIAGSYSFKLTVTDNELLTGSDTVQIAVKPAQVNVPPLADAGNDSTITLPVNTLQLNGIGTDADGSIASYAWRKVSGPSSYMFSDSGVAKPMISNLSQGVYGFELTVTDNNGLTNKDTVYMTVETASVITSQRILIDAGLANGTTSSPDPQGRYWNNMTDARPGLRVNNAVTIANIPTSIKLQVVNPAGSSGPTDLNIRTSGAIGNVGEYPASATNDNAFANKSITNGMWRIYGLDATTTYTVKFWGSYSLAESRIIQIKRSDETAWQEYNAALNTNINTAAGFTFTGKTEMSFNIRVKSGNSFGHINVIDILATSQDQQSSNEPPAARRTSQMTTISEQQTVPNQNLSLYPNPGNNSSVLKLQNQYVGLIKISVINAVGVISKQSSVYKVADLFTHRIDLSKLSPGKYFLYIGMGNKTETMSFIKF